MNQIHFTLHGLGGQVLNVVLRTVVVDKAGLLLSHVPTAHVLAAEVLRLIAQLHQSPHDLLVVLRGDVALTCVGLATDRLALLIRPARLHLRLHIASTESAPLHAVC